MSSRPIEIIISSKKASHLQRRHPWIFSGALLKGQALPDDGALVTVKDEQGLFQCYGHFQNHGSISVRVLSFDERELPNEHFFLQKLQSAWEVRKGILPENTSAFRWVHGEGDGLPGLIADVYGSVVVFQCHSMGMFRIRKMLTNCMQQVNGPQISTIYCKSADTLPGSSGISNEFLLGDQESIICTEMGVQMDINWLEGQKTGTFLDQRDNRALLRKYAEGSKVLDLFCNNGGFTLHALMGGASFVDYVDSSAKAIERVERNLQINSFDTSKSQGHCSDCLKYLQQTTKDFDIVVVDPPAFAKSLQKRHNAVQGYKRLNVAAIKKVRKGGLMFTFSCSQVVDETLFYNTIVAACIESGRSVQVLHKLTQGPDHPVDIYHKEGAYLKGLVLRID